MQPHAAAALSAEGGLLQQRGRLRPVEVLLLQDDEGAVQGIDGFGEVRVLLPEVTLLRLADVNGLGLVVLRRQSIVLEG